VDRIVDEEIMPGWEWVFAESMDWENLAAHAARVPLARQYLWVLDHVPWLCLDRYQRILLRDAG
jgi:predicted TIM-barrel fold metal-dependent hydrolase